MLRGLIATLALMATVAAAHAEKRVALVIGNSAYSAIQPLSNPKSDAELIATTLDDLGFEVISAIDVDYRAMSKAVQSFGRSLRGAGKDGVGLLYYAGHGIQASGANYLLPVDASVETEADLRLNALSASDILAQMEQAGNALNIVILDACRNNPFQGRFRSATRGLARIEAPSGSLIAYAAAPGQLAADGTGDNSPYAAALAKAMRKPGLDLIKVFRQVRLDVEAATRAQQTPWEEQSLRGDFYFVPGTPGAAPATQAPPAAGNDAVELAYWASIKDSGSVAAFEAYLARYPKGLFAELAAIKIRELKQKLAVGVFPEQELPATRQYKPGDRFRDCDHCPEMVVVPAGSFTMGSPDDEKGRINHEGPRHEVRIGEAFAVGRFEVSIAEWGACLAGRGCNGYRPNDLGWGDGNRPVISVSWYDAQAYVKWLNGKVDGSPYRLLTEAEWEYVARAGTSTPFYTGRTITTDQANFDGNHTYGEAPKGKYVGKTVPVGSFPANAFGLHDMHGNVWEWTEDCWHPSYHGSPGDGSARTSQGECVNRVLRGGAWNTRPEFLRAAFRYRYTTGYRYGDSVGFRVAKTLTP